MVVVGGSRVGKTSFCRCLWGDAGFGGRLSKKDRATTSMKDRDQQHVEFTSSSGLTIRPWYVRQNRSEEEAKKLANLSLRPMSQTVARDSQPPVSSQSESPFLHVWDFGNVQLLGSGLPFFICQERINSLVVMVVDGLDTELHHFRSWLRIVRSKDRKLENVIVVVTHLDEINEEQYRKICTLIQTIAGTNLPIMPINASEPSFVPEFTEIVLRILSRLRWWTEKVVGKLILTHAYLFKEAFIVSLSFWDTRFFFIFSLFFFFFFFFSLSPPC